MNKNSAARIAANNKYNEKAYDRINVAVPKGTKTEIEEHIKHTGDPSVNAFVKRAITETMKRDANSVNVTEMHPTQRMQKIQELKEQRKKQGE